MLNSLLPSRTAQLKKHSFAAAIKVALKCRSTSLSKSVLTLQSLFLDTGSQIIVFVQEVVYMTVPLIISDVETLVFSKYSRSMHQWHTRAVV